ncbi:1-aminocyclopropane-1-carboxylate deaminase/D-cysteine desulfhydrase [Candidatus Cetobacterium colombiensis]|jgi:D-cysteine desulfhydrase|uniref:D-cysteine desulfhydrase family protein n=1 Tax=Candidatus Cetobacterium colombiensis TaxID=3073100 RepID=A0ABU4W654_9FUSO|nr:D-cysteine desulfhydrase family protein [Candidatus Cetobacterium colombiensis]MDX8335011.1 D-cysteine desulfhydrase family protein [Candidatus Cetobacterium colombiensis]
MENKISIANLPTKIEKLKKISRELNVNIYIKRDDQTGTEISGNKVRKLEYSIKEAIDNGCDTLITCGGIQSNHARSTVAAGIKVGLSSVLVLRTNEEPEVDGNYLIDQLLGADIKFITSDEYSNKREEIMENIKSELLQNGRKGYIIPEGASNGIGSLGYIEFAKEVLDYEKEVGIEFDTIVVAVGSGGTYAGIHMGNNLYLDGKKRILGFNVCDTAEFFEEKVKNIILESKNYLNKENSKKINLESIEIIDGYVGEGYALSNESELDFIWNLAKNEGVILDPVYTGKAMYGLYNELKKNKFKETKNILFVHTGGLFGLFPKKNQFNFKKK